MFRLLVGAGGRWIWAVNEAEFRIVVGVELCVMPFGWILFWARNCGFAVFFRRIDSAKFGNLQLSPDRSECVRGRAAVKERVGGHGGSGGPTCHTDVLMRVTGCRWRRCGLGDTGVELGCRVPGGWCRGSTHSRVLKSPTATRFVILAQGDRCESPNHDQAESCPRVGRDRVCVADARVCKRLRRRESTSRSIRRMDSRLRGNDGNENQSLFSLDGICSG